MQLPRSPELCSIDRPTAMLLSTFFRLSLFCRQFGLFGFTAFPIPIGDATPPLSFRKTSQVTVAPQNHQL